MINAMFSIDVLDCILVLAIAPWHYTILRRLLYMVCEMMLGLVIVLCHHAVILDRGICFGSEKSDYVYSCG